MEGIFQNPRLGDKFVLDKPYKGDVQYIVYLGKRTDFYGKFAYIFATQRLKDGDFDVIFTDINGKCMGDFEGKTVVSRWEDPIDEAELERRAEDYATHRPYDDRWSEWQTCKNGYMAGYREAKNGK